jgi:hypothetical protein
MSRSSQSWLRLSPRTAQPGRSWRAREDRVASAPTPNTMSAISSWRRTHSSGSASHAGTTIRSQTSPSHHISPRGATTSRARPRIGRSISSRPMRPLICGRISPKRGRTTCILWTRLRRRARSKCGSPRLSTGRAHTSPSWTSTLMSLGRSMRSLKPGRLLWSPWIASIGRWADLISTRSFLRRQSSRSCASFTISSGGTAQSPTQRLKRPQQLENAVPH